MSLRWPDSFRFLTRLNAPISQSDRDSVERVLGVTRVLLAAISLAAVYVDPTEPTTYLQIAYSMLACWLLYSFLLFGWLSFHHASPRLIIVLHAIDVLWPAVITLFTEGPNSPFFVFFVSALIGAGFRWGFPEALTTAVVGIGLLDMEALMFSGSLSNLQTQLIGQFELNRLVIRCAYTLMVGVLVGYLAEIAKERRAESSLINRVLSIIGAERVWGSSLQTVLNEYTRVFDAQKAYVLMHNLSTGRIFLWQMAPLLPESRPYYRELDSSTPGQFMLAAEPRTFFARKRGARVQFSSLDGTYEHSARPELPFLPFDTGKYSSILSSSYLVSDDWTVRLVLIDARVGANVERELRFAEELLRGTAPSLYSIYLVRRLRTRAGAIERARVARELHDGAIQSIISVEMQVDVLRRTAERDASPMSPDLAHVQNLLQQEVLNLRELMQQMRPVDMSPHQFLDFLADTVDRFRRDNGIEASFVSDLQEVELTPHTCRELARILQEALVNIRKHAAATNVLVRFGREDSTWKLVVDDDGRGFDFSGKLSLQELNNVRKGPTVIKERVRIIGGDLSIESTPGSGTRLEITLPLKGRIAHG